MMSGLDEPSRLLVVDLFGKKPVKEGIGDAHLMQRPGTGQRKLQNGVNSS